MYHYFRATMLSEVQSLICGSHSGMLALRDFTNLVVRSKRALADTEVRYKVESLSHNVGR